MLWLIVDVARYAEERIELGRKKKLPTPEDLNPNTRFIDNAVIRQIGNTRQLTDYLDKRSLGWVNYPELVKKLYAELVASDYYRDYMSASGSGYRQDVKLVEDFYVKTVSDNALLEEVVEEQSILWADDVDFALVMVVRTLGDCRASMTEVPLLPEFKNDDDREFVRELFRKTLVNYKEYLSYVEKFTQNWDVDRIAFMDNLIMTSALAELLNFPSIPVKVTLDEFIEIAKYYSTPGSSLFINGVLDKIIESLKAEGRVNKTGRGLL